MKLIVINNPLLLIYAPVWISRIPVVIVCFHLAVYVRLCSRQISGSFIFLPRVLLRFCSDETEVHFLRFLLI